MALSDGLLDVLAREKGAVRRFLLARTRSEALADDFLSDLWVKARAVDGGEIGNASAYLYRMANNLVLDHLREERRRARRELDWTSEQVGPVSATAEAAAPDPNAEEGLLKAEERRQLSEAIAALPEGARRVLRMHKLEGMSHSEVATALGISRSAVEKHMAVAMTHLRRHLGGLR
jgi:RNA polymerase sigma-70 factor (ECF subfamily)